MKLMFLGVFNKNSTNYSQALAFEHLGIDVKLVEYRDILKRFGKEDGEKDIVRYIKQEKPDIVLYSKCNNLSTSVLEQAHDMSAINVLWYMDPIHNYNTELQHKIYTCDHSFFALEEPYNKAKLQLGSRIHFLEEGFDETVDKPTYDEKTIDVSFIGSLYGNRKDYIEELKALHITNAYGKLHAEAVSKSRINLNFTSGGTSDRTYKILASQGFLLTQPWEGMEKNFVNGEHLVTFNNIDQAKQKIKYYLNNPLERERIAMKGYLRVQKFNRINWASSILETVL